MRSKYSHVTPVHAEITIKRQIKISRSNISTKQTFIYSNSTIEILEV